MGSLSDRIRALEEPDRDYPPHVVAEALRRIPTEELKSYVEILKNVVESGAPEKLAQPIVLRVTELCQEIVKENSRV